MDGMAMMHGSVSEGNGSGFLAPCRGGRHSDSFRLSFFFTSDEEEGTFFFPLLWVIRRGAFWGKRRAASALCTANEAIYR